MGLRAIFSGLEARVGDGLAILNDDNPYIAGYEPPIWVRTVYYGSTARSQYSASDLASRWPERLSFTLNGPGGEPRRVTTRLVGEHWTSSLLPGLVVAALDEAIAALAACEPVERRMSPVDLPNGATLLRDEINGSVDTMAAALKAFGEATALRKMLVFSDVSDSSKKPRTRLRDYGRAAAKIANSAMFLGENCEHGAQAAVEADLPAIVRERLVRLR